MASRVCLSRRSLGADGLPESLPSPRSWTAVKASVSGDADIAIDVGIGSADILDNDIARLVIAPPSIMKRDTDHTVQFPVTLDQAVDGGFDVAFSDTPGTAGYGDHIMSSLSPLGFSGDAG